MADMTLGGPMFEAAQSGAWRSIHNKTGAHYNIYACQGEHGMAALRQFFPDANANEMNAVLFSTSGVHGTYGTIEEAERELLAGVDEDGDPVDPSVTFLVVQPRIVCLRYGNCRPQNTEDIAFLKRLRDTSWTALQGIGRPSVADEAEL